MSEKKNKDLDKNLIDRFYKENLPHFKIQKPTLGFSPKHPTIEPQPINPQDYFPDFPRLPDSEKTYFPRKRFERFDVKRRQMAFKDEVKSFDLLRITGDQKDPIITMFLCLVTFGFYWGIWCRRVIFELTLSLKIQMPDEIIRENPWMSFRKMTRYINRLLLFSQQRLMFEFIDQRVLNALGLLPPLYIFYVQKKLNQYLAAVGQTNRDLTK